MKMRICLIVLFALCVSGCASLGQPISKFLCVLPDASSRAGQEEEVASRGVLGSATHYLANRGLDFADIFKINVGIGPGLSANARVTQIIQAGAGYTGATKVGLSGRHAGFWNENALEAGIPLIVYGRDVAITPGGGNIARINSYRQQFLWKFEFRDPEAKEINEAETYDTDYDRKFFEVGASVHALIPAFEFSINLQELIDFLVGFTTIDLCGDDSK